MTPQHAAGVRLGGGFLPTFASVAIKITERGSAAEPNCAGSVQWSWHRFRVPAWWQLLPQSD